MKQALIQSCSCNLHQDKHILPFLQLKTKSNMKKGWAEMGQVHLLVRLCGWVVGQNKGNSKLNSGCFNLRKVQKIDFLLYDPALRVVAKNTKCVEYLYKNYEIFWGQVIQRLHWITR